MKTPTPSRRNFLKTSLAAGLGLAGAAVLHPTAASGIEPFKRAGAARFRLSLAAYSFRDDFNTKDDARRMNFFKFIDYCAGQGCDAAELTAYYFPPDVTDDFLLEVRRHAFLRGVSVSGTAVGNNFALLDEAKRRAQIADTKKWIDRAAVLGAPHIRVFAGPTPKDTPLADAKRVAIAALEECCDYAGRKGIFLGLENHGGIVAESKDLLEIVHAVKSPWFGVNLDTGNFRTDDPYADLAACAPYAVNVQVKLEIQPRGQREKSPADLARVVTILREAAYQGYLALEYESKPDPWEGVPAGLKRLREALAVA